MFSLKQIAVLAFVGLAFGGCATFGATAEQAQLKAAKVALTTYTDFAQPAMLAYGRLPTCDDIHAKPLCKDAGAWAKIQLLSAAAHQTIQAARPVVAGEIPDTGQIGAAMAAIDAANTAFKQR